MTSIVDQNYPFQDQKIPGFVLIVDNEWREKTMHFEVVSVEEK